MLEDGLYEDLPIHPTTSSGRLPLFMSERKGSQLKHDPVDQVTRHLLTSIQCSSIEKVAAQLQEAG